MIINKAMAQDMAEKIPEHCPNCPSDANFELIYVSDSLTSGYDIKHTCGWKKDVNDPDLI